METDGGTIPGTAAQPCARPWERAEFDGLDATVHLADERNTTSTPDAKDEMAGSGKSERVAG